MSEMLRVRETGRWIYRVKMNRNGEKECAHDTTQENERVSVSDHREREDHLAGHGGRYKLCDKGDDRGHCSSCDDDCSSIVENRAEVP